MIINTLDWHSFYVGLACGLTIYSCLTLVVWVSFDYFRRPKPYSFKIQREDGTWEVIESE